MKRYIIFAFLIIVMIIGVISYRAFLTSQKAMPELNKNTSDTKEISKFIPPRVQVTITAKKNQWRFEPNLIEVKKGDKVVATIVNEDDYDHGFTIDEFKISKHLEPKSAIIVEFIADKEGDFTFYCSVPCGEGIVDGQKRGHTDMTGIIRVKA